MLSTLSKAAVLSLAFLVLFAPGATGALTLSAVEPDVGHVLGGEEVTIIGGGFSPTGTITVTFGGEPATNVYVGDLPYCLRLVCTTPPHAAGVVDVVVTNPGDPPEPATLEDGFTYVSHMITEQPQGAVKYVGESHTFTVTASGGTPPYTYKWQRKVGGGSFEDIPGATSDSHAIDPIGLADDALYRCLVEDQSTYVLPSDSAQLDVYEHLSITSHPEDAECYEGGSATFTVLANGGKPLLIHRWQKNGTDIVGAPDDPSYEIPAAVLADAGSYRCVVADSDQDAAVSNAAALDVFLLEVVPGAGALAGGTNVQINGIFNVTMPHVTSVDFAASAASNVSLVDSHTITCTTPAHAAGAVDVIITNPTMYPSTTQVITNGFTYADFYFSQQPEGGDKYTDESHSFTVTVAGGTGPYTYQWQKFNDPDWDNVGANADTYTLGPPLALADAGTYRCVVNDSSKSQITSDEAVLTVSEHLAITTHPTADEFNYTGESHTFSVETSGGLGVVHYQWRKNGTGSGANVPGANSSTYAIDPLTEDDSGDVYRCYVSDDGIDSELSDPAPALEVWDPVAIDLQPQGGQYYVGASHIFTAMASGGRGETLNYQWQEFNDPDWDDLPGKITTSLSIDPLSAADSGQYRCRVDDAKAPAGTDVKTTDPADLVVAEHLSIVTHPTADPYNYAGSSHTFTVATQGGLVTIHYQWQKFNDPTWDDIPGEQSDSYEINPLQVSDSGSYRVHVWDDGGDSENSNEAVLTVEPLVFIETSPSSADVYEGDSHALSVVASGGHGSLHYQWQKFNDPSWDDVGPDDPSYVIDPLAMGHAGSYRCVVSDEGTSMALSATAVLSVFPHVGIVTPPAGAHHYVGESHMFEVEAQGGRGSLHYQWQKFDDPDWDDILGAVSDSYTIDPLALEDSGSYRCVVSDDGTDEVPSAAADLTVVDYLHLSHVDPDSGIAAGGETVTIYTIDGKGFVATGTTTVTFGGADATDVNVVDPGTLTCTTPAHAPGTVDVTVLNPDLITTDTLVDGFTYASFLISTQPQGGVYYTGESHTFTIVVTGGAPPIEYAWERNLDSSPGWALIPGEESASLTIDPVAPEHSGLYRCQVSDASKGGPLTSDEVRLSVYDHLSITADPQSADRYVGESVTLSVTASGGKPPLQYEWLFNGAPGGGPVDATWVIDNLQHGNQGLYSCAVSDADTDSETSAEALVAVYDPISIDQQPAGGSAYVGDSYTFSIAASGGIGALQYQWRKDGQPITGAEEATYERTELTTDDTGMYSCEVSDDGSSIVSDEVELLVTYGVPVAGLAGLSMLVAGTALAAALALRRKR